MIYSDESYDDTKFSDEELSEIVIESSFFENCQFTQCRFQKVQFLSCVFTQLVFENCAFENCLFADSTLDSCTFKNSKVIGTDFSEGKRLSDLSFVRSVLSYTNFAGCEITTFKVEKSQCHETVFTTAKLKGADFLESDFKGALFHGANLEGANFSNAYNYQIDITDTVLKNAIFTLPEAVNLLRIQGIQI